MLSVIIIIYGCHKKSEIKKVEFAKSFCFGSCVAAAISVDSTGNYKLYSDSSLDWNFKGKRPAKRSYIGKIDNKYWKDLTRLLDETDYKNPDTAKKIELADVQHFEVFIYEGNAKIRLTLPWKSLYPVYKFIDSTSHLIKLQRVPDTLQFGTTLQIDERLLHKNRLIK